MRRRHSLAALVVLLPIPAAAQIVTHQPLALRFPGGTRAAAMANASLATRDDEVLFYNPAQLSVARGVSASWQHVGDAELRGASAAIQSGSLGVGIGVQQLSYESTTTLPVEPSAVGLDGDLPASSTSLAVGVARIFKGIRTGIAGRVTDDVAGGRRTRSTLDLGAGRAFGPVNVGLTVQHLGTSDVVGTTRFRPPTQATLGVNGEGIARGDFDLAGGASISVHRDGRIVPRTGWEVGWVWIEGHALQGRIGARRPEWAGQSWLTLGAGLTRDNLSLDYAYEGAGDAPRSHRVGVRVR